MPDAKERVSTTFVVDGVEYTIKLGMGAQKAYQVATKETVVDSLQAMETSFDMVRLSALFRYALKPRLEEDAADDLIDRIGIGKASKMILAASEEAFKDLGDPPKEPPAK